VTLTANDSHMVAATQPPAVSIGPATDSRQSAGPQDAPVNTRRTAGRKSIPARIAIVDDEPLNIQVVQKYLYDAGYEQFITTADSSKALDLIHRERPDLILLDIMMPVVSGLDILQALQAGETTQHLPVLILTAANDAGVKRKALERGATDFLPKPVDPHELLPRVRNALLTKAYHDRLTNENARLETEVRRRTTELAASREEVVHCLARASEYRDDDTGHHVMRVGQHVGVIARGLGFTEGQIELLELAAQLHDLGKIAIPDSILHCPGKLDPEQFDLMKTHCGIAKKIMQPLAEEQWRILRSHARVGAGLLHVRSSPLLMLAAKIAQTHHEWWDGTGYPLGLAREDIPIEGRMTAVADVYDALSSRRPYKEPFPREKCFAILEEGRGTHFDPKVLDVFFQRKEEIINIQLQYMDVT
jgi:putative two-component system response regulator